MTISGDPRQWQVGMLGYGEVGRILAEDLRQQGVRVSAYDIKLDREQGTALRAHAAEIGVELAQSHADLAARADFIISAVTASQAVPVAAACAPAIRKDVWFSISTRPRPAPSSARRRISTAPVAAMSRAR